MNYNDHMGNPFEEFEQGLRDKFLDDSVTRRQRKCPYCKELLPEAYLDQNPFPEVPCIACGRAIEVSSLIEVELNAPDERADIRCPASLKVTYESVSEFITEYTKNVSRGGMFIATKRPHEIGSQVDLDLHVPGLDTPLKIKGEVVHAKQHNVPDEDAGIGVRFIDIQEESRLALLDFLKSQSDCS